MKSPLSWHRECLANMLLFHEERKKRLEALQKEVSAAEQRIMFYKSQIARAEKMGRDSFDEEKFAPEANWRKSETP